MAEKEVKIKVKAGTQPLKDLQSELKKAKEDLARLDLQGKKNSATYKEQAAYVAGLSKEYDRLQTAGKNAAKGVDETSKGIQDLSTKIGVAAVGMVALVGSFNKVVQMASEGAGFQTLYSSFERLAGGTEAAKKNLELFGKAAAGNLDTTQLITYANEMQSLGYSVDIAAKLLDIAEVKSDELGLSFEAGQDALQKYITTGSGRGLLQLGINIGDVKKAMEDYTGATEEQINELDELQQQQIRATVITKLYGSSIDDINKKQKGNDDIVSNLQATYRDLGTLLNVFVASAFVEVAKKSDVASNSLSENMNAVSKWGEEIGQAINYAVMLGGALQTVNSYLANQLPILNALLNPYEALRDVLYQIGVLSKVASPTSGNPLGVETFGPVGSPEQIEEAKQKQLRIDIQNQLDKTKPGSTKGGTSKTKKETEKTIETVSADLLKVSLESLQDAIYNRNLSGITAEAVGRGGMLFDEQKSFLSVDTEGALKDEREKAIEDGKTVYNNITNIMSLLGLEAQSFVGTLISGFNTVLAIMESIKAVNTILSFIPGLATGGSVAAGMPYIVGEKGAELFMPNSNGQIFSHEKTMKILSQSNNMNAPAVNIYVGGTLDGQTFLKNNFPKYQSMKNYKRIN